MCDSLLFFYECRFSCTWQTQHFLAVLWISLLYCWLVSLYLGILLVMTFTLCSPLSVSLPPSGKARGNGNSADEMQRAFRRISSCQMMCCRLAGCISNPASFASASLVHLIHWKQLECHVMQPLVVAVVYIQYFIIKTLGCAKISFLYFVCYGHHWDDWFWPYSAFSSWFVFCIGNSFCSFWSEGGGAT